MCGNFCVGFITYMFMGKNLRDNVNVFSPNNFKKNYDIIFTLFSKKTLEWLRAILLNPLKRILLIHQI